MENNTQQRATHTLLSTTSMTEAREHAKALGELINGESYREFQVVVGGYPGGCLVSLTYVGNGSPEVESEALSLALVLVTEALVLKSKKEAA